MRPRRRGGAGGNLGVLLLAAQVFNMGIENIPPITLALVAGQAAIFLGYGPQYFNSVSSVCMSTYLVWHRRDFRRLILSQFFHADDLHLYFNMASLLVKGRTLESKFGSVYFLWMVSVFTALTGIGYVAINLILEDRFQDHSYATQCAVGFSGVLFALKVVTTHYTPPGLHYLMGFIPVPSRMIYWAELLLIQLITPNASFTGHLAGILVGLLYIKGPLKPLMDGLISPESATRYRGGGQSTGYRQQSWFSSGGATGNGYYSPPSPPPPQHGNYQYTGGLSEEEQYRRAMEESRQFSHASSQPQPSSPPAEPTVPPPPSGGLYPDLQELRDRRAARYQ